MNKDDEIDRNTTEARQGETSNHMRWVLLVSTAFAIVALFVATFVFHYRH